MVEQDNILEYVYSFLNEVLPDKVYYSLNISERINLPFIVYQEISKRASVFAEDKPVFYMSTIQITLVTKKKDPALETKLKTTLLKNGYTPQNLSEFRNEDGSINKIYEVRLEEI